MTWLDLDRRFLFFTGKGGVGKTTVASATAVRLADQGRRVLIVSTDPASNLGDVFGLSVGTNATKVPNVEMLSVMNIDPEAAAATYRERVVGPYRGVLPDAAVRNIEEQLSGACTVEIAAFDEFTGLLADSETVDRYDHVVFDTAPTGHTLRLLSLPSAWSGFIASNTTGASCLGPLAGLEAQRDRYAETVRALSDGERTVVVLVSRPDDSAVREAARAGGELAALGIKNQRLVINGVLEDNPGNDAVAQAFAQRQRVALDGLPPTLALLPRIEIPLVPNDLTGLDALRAFSDSSSYGRPATPADLNQFDDVAAAPGLDDLIATLGVDRHGVIMTMGKGGVGKTSLAAAIAIRLAEAGHSVHLSTTDPAAHVDDAAGAYLPSRLSVDRIDPVVEIARYTAEVIGEAGALDAEELALLEEGLRSPCTEEIAVFRAFARTVARASDGFVVLDTAPTGHTLLLLDAAQSYHREVARTTGAHIPSEVRELLPRLRDPQYTKMLLVTLAEATPVHEAERLQADLHRAGIDPFGWVVNASLLASGTTHPLLAARASLEAAHIRRVRSALSARAWIIPWTAGSLVHHATEESFTLQYAR